MTLVWPKSFTSGPRIIEINEVNKWVYVQLKKLIRKIKLT